MKAITQRMTSLLFTAASALAQQYVISTVAGGVPIPTPIAGVNASIGVPSRIATDRVGNVYFTTLRCVFKLDPNGVLTRVAGTSRAGDSGDGGQATNAQLTSPVGVAVDSGSNVYIADYGANRIRKVSTNGIITTVAGNGSLGCSGGGGVATNAQLCAPQGVAVDGGGNLYIADSSSETIRKVSPSGVITTVAGNNRDGYSGDGGSATSAALSLPLGVAVDSGGNLYIADSGNNRIRKVSPSGLITTVAGNGTEGDSGDGGPAIAAQLAASDVAVDADGNFYISDRPHNRIRKVSPTGTITTVAGNGRAGYSGDRSPAISAQLFSPRGVAVDSGGSLYIADSANNRIRQVSPSAVITTVAGNGSYSYSGDGGPATSIAFH